MVLFDNTEESETTDELDFSGNVYNHTTELLHNISDDDDLVDSYTTKTKNVVKTSKESKVSMVVVGEDMRWIPNLMY